MDSSTAKCYMAVTVLIPLLPGSPTECINQLSYLSTGLDGWESAGFSGEFELGSSQTLA